jgi:hypothetical protein
MLTRVKGMDDVPGQHVVHIQYLIVSPVQFLEITEWGEFCVRIQAVPVAKGYQHSFSRTVTISC